MSEDPSRTETSALLCAAKIAPPPAVAVHFLNVLAIIVTRAGPVTLMQPPFAALPLVMVSPSRATWDPPETCRKREVALQSIVVEDCPAPLKVMFLPFATVMLQKDRPVKLPGGQNTFFDREGKQSLFEHDKAVSSTHGDGTDKADHAYHLQGAPAHHLPGALALGQRGRRWPHREQPAVCSGTSISGLRKGEQGMHKQAWPAAGPLCVRQTMYKKKASLHLSV